MFCINLSYKTTKKMITKTKEVGPLLNGRGDHNEVITWKLFGITIYKSIVK